MRPVARCVMRMAWLACVVALAPASASAMVRTLFVGVDTYAHSIARNPKADPSFHDLRGAVNDVRLMQKTLATDYAVEIAPTDCDLTRTISITLINACATRTNILAALEHLISAGKPGDILLFYYAGHGSQHSGVGRQTMSQASRVNSTNVPADAWRPADPVSGSNDIVDVELKALIDEANRVGVSVVTIFDSCHSGTATRDLLGGFSREAPPDALTAAPAPMVWSAPQPSAPASTRAYRVHMAAAGDDQIAYETSGGPPVHGVFTAALAKAVAQRKGGAYLDIAQEVGWQLAQEGEAPNVALSQDICPPSETCANAGGAKQASQEEGDVTAPFLGAAPDPIRAYEADAGRGRGRHGEHPWRLPLGGDARFDLLGLAQPAVRAGGAGPTPGQGARQRGGQWLGHPDPVHALAARGAERDGRVSRRHGRQGAVGAGTPARLRSRPAQGCGRLGQPGRRRGHRQRSGAHERA